MLIFFPIISSCSGFNVWRPFVLLRRNKKKKKKALQDTTKAFIENFAVAFLKEEETEIGPTAAIFKYINPLSNSQDFLLSSIGRSKLNFPIYN